MKLVGSLLKFLGPVGENEIKFDTRAGEGCSVSFWLKKLDPAETFEPVEVFGTPGQGLSQMTHMESCEDNSLIFGMSDADEGQKCPSLQMEDDDFTQKSETPNFRRIGSAKKIRPITISPLGQSRKRSFPQADGELKGMPKDVPLSSKMGWVTSPVILFG